MKLAPLIFIALIPTLTSCNTIPPEERFDGVTVGAGEAIAANTAMQTADPWPTKSLDPSITVPADRSPYQSKSDNGNTARTTTTSQ